MDSVGPIVWPDVDTRERTARNDWHDGPSVEPTGSLLWTLRSKAVQGRWLPSRTARLDKPLRDSLEPERIVEGPSQNRQMAALVFFLMICFAFAGLGALLTNPALETWYAKMAGLFWKPPDWTFTSGGNFLYAALALAGWLVWRRHGTLGAEGALALFFVQLMLNAVWAGLFFAFHSSGAALAELGLLWLVSVATLVAFWRLHRGAGLLLVPQLGWLILATVLNVGAWNANL